MENHYMIGFMHGVGLAAFTFFCHNVFTTFAL